MTELSPVVSVLSLSIGLVFALFCYLITNLSPGGMITPGWLALVLIADPQFALLILAVAVITYFVSLAVRRVVILYGKRLFATVVLIGVFLQVTIFVFNTQIADASDYTTLGFIIPGLLAYQLIRQPIFATLTATATVASLAYVVVLVGVRLGFVRAEEGATGGGGAPEISAGPLQLVLVGVVLAIGLGALIRSVRGVERTRVADAGADA